MTIKVSVIIPVFNAEKYLRQCLDSIVNQTLKDIEIICVDDGSTDGSLEILREYEAQDQRVKVLTQQNQFAGVARNNGIEMARGEYCVFWDADDFFHLDALNQMYMTAKAHSADICLCGGDRFDTNQNTFIPTPWWFKKAVFDTEVINSKTHSDDIFEVTTMAPWTKLYSVNFIRKQELRFQKLPRANDVFFTMMSLSLAEKVVGTSQVFIHYRIGDGNNLQAHNEKSPLAFCEALSAVKEELIQRGVFERVLNAFRNKALSLCVYNLLTLRNAPEAFQSLKQELLARYLQEYHINTLSLETVFIKDDYMRLLSLLRGDGVGDSLFDLYFQTNQVPMVSLIVPVFNEENYLQECLGSLTKQTYTDLEILCVDDCSTDASLAILQRMAEKDCRIHVIALKKNRHQGGARNAGLNEARGKYVWFVDADDYIDADAVERLVREMENLKDVDMISFHSAAFVENGTERTETEEGRIIRRWPKNTKIELPKDSHRLPDIIEGSSVTCFYKRAFVDSFRFRENATFEDADFSFDALTSTGTFYELDYAPYHRRITASSTTGEGAKGLNRDCILGRVLAAEEIYRIICKKALTSDHYAVVWAKRWFRFAFGLYLARPELRSKEYDNIIISIQREFRPYSIQQIFATAEIRAFFFPEQVIVSLTSYPARIDRVHEVIESVINQTVCADRIILYLADEQFVDRQLPKPLVDLCTQYDCFEIHFCDDDLKPHKKYYYAMQDFPDAALITVDDDVIYPNTMVEELLNSYFAYPDSVSSMRGHVIAMQDADRFAPYETWQKERKTIGVPSFLNLATGVCGVLYPPHIMPKALFNKERIKAECLNQDDLWLKWFQLKNKVKCVIVKEDNGIDYVKDSQASGLWVSNQEGKNDIVWEQLVKSDNGMTYSGEPIVPLLFVEYFHYVCKQYDDLKKDYRFAQNSIKQLEKTRDDLKRKVRLERDHIAKIQQSHSYRLGRVLSWPYRKLKQLLKRLLK